MGNCNRSLVIRRPKELAIDCTTGIYTNLPEIANFSMHYFIPDKVNTDEDGIE